MSGSPRPALATSRIREAISVRTTARASVVKPEAEAGERSFIGPRIANGSENSCSSAAEPALATAAPAARPAQDAAILRAHCPRNTSAYVVLSLIVRLLAIAVCGGGGGLLAWVIVSALGATGVGGAIAGAVIGMVLATVLWASGIALR